MARDRKIGVTETAAANHNTVATMDALVSAEREADSAVIIVCEDSERSGAVACE